MREANAQAVVQMDENEEQDSGAIRTSRRQPIRQSTPDRTKKIFGIRATFGLDLGFEDDDNGKPLIDPATKQPVLKEREVEGFESPTEFTPAIDPSYVFPLEETKIFLLGLTLKDRMLLVGGTGTGKCLGRGTPVLKYDGTITAVEEVRENDLLMGPDSKPRRVKGTTRGTGPLYKIVPVKGESWVCNDVHVLTLVHSVTGQIIDIPLDEYLQKTAKWKHAYKLYQPSVVHFNDDKPATSLPIDPYFVGIWYGDGSHSLRNIQVSKPDAEIEMACRMVAKSFGLHVNVYAKDGKCPTYHLATEKGQSNPLLNTMREVITDVDRIPQLYLTASESQRLELLAGILDTDGHLTCGSYEIVQSRKELCSDIAFLARSLGFRVTERVKVVNEKSYYRLFISGEVSRIPLRLARKQASERKQKKNALRTGFSVESLGEGEYFGFELDSDGRFLLGDFTVTHNTSLIEQVAARLNYNVVKINFDGCVTRQDLIGEWVVKGREMMFQYGILVHAFQMPGTIIILDEWDTISGECSFVLQRPLQKDDGKILILETGGELIPLHPDNAIIATANTCGQGDDTGLYTQGTKVQNYAQLNRFGITIRMKYLEEAKEVEMIQKRFDQLKPTECAALVKAVNAVRDGYNNGQLSVPLSPRDLIGWADKYLRLGCPIRAARYVFMNRMPEQDAIVTEQIIQRTFAEI